MVAFIVSPECVDLGLRAGAVLLHNVRISVSDTELRERVASESRAILSRFDGLAEVRNIPELSALYEVFRGVSVNPRYQPPSIQRLYQYILKQGKLPAVNNLVDAYNLMSVQTRCSMGAHDLDKITVPVELRLFRGDETFTPLGSSDEKTVIGGEFGYVDAKNRVLCRLDVLQAEFSKVTSDTTNALLIIEGTTAFDPGTLKNIFEETITFVQRYCGGTAGEAAFPC